MTYFSATRLLLASASILGLAPAIAFAATSADTVASSSDTTTAKPGSASAIGDIVVTAQRRAESSQRAPLSIDVLSSDALREAGVTQATDISKIAPGVNIAMGGSATQIFVRGAGTPTTTPLSDPSVSLNLDGVYLAQSQNFNGTMFDMERIEVLKGPQGTLYGRNSSGGALNEIAVTPKLGETSGYIQLGAQNYNGLNAEGAINLPINQTLAIRAAFQVVHRDGYINDGTNDDKHQSGRLQLLWKPSDGFKLRLWGSYQHIGGEGPGYVNYEPNGAYGGVVAPQVPSDRWSSLLPVVNSAFQTMMGGNPNFDPATQAYQDIKAWNIHAQADISLGQVGTLTIIPAFQDTTIRAASFPGIEYTTTNYQTGAPQESKATTVEARISDNGGSRLTYTLGFFYFHDYVTNNATVYLGESAPGILTPSGGLGLTYTGNIYTTSYAGFGQATYELFHNFKVIGGIRYTNQTENITNGTQCVLIFYPASAPCIASAVGADGSTVMNTRVPADNRVNWKAGFEYEATRQNMLYFTAATGFKAGGQQVAAVPAYKPETITAYTLGSKNRFFGGKLQANLELFYWKFNNKQEPMQVIDENGNSASDIVNAGTATSKGVSIDLRGKLTANDMLYFNGEYNHARYNNFVWTAYTTAPSTGCPYTPIAGSTNYTVNCSGYQLMRSPDWSGSAGYTHTFRISNGGHIDANVNTTFASSRWLMAAFIPNAQTSGYALVNLGLTYVAPSDKYTVDFFVQNVGNTAVYNGGDQQALFGYIMAATIGAPRVIGGRIRYNF